MPSNDPLYQWLSHPLLLLIVGAAVSSYLVPMITRRWRDHQKELELKTGLVGQISEAITTILMAVQFAEMGSVSQKQEDFDRAYRDWEIKRATIASHLRAYFPQTNIASDWEALSQLVTDFYALTGIVDHVARRRHLAKFQDDSFLGSVDLDWDALVTRNKKEGYATFIDNWNVLKRHLLRRKDSLVQSILNTQISTF